MLLSELGPHGQEDRISIVQPAGKGLEVFAPVFPDRRFNRATTAALDLTFLSTSGSLDPLRTGRLIAKGAKVDVVWRAKIANLEVINYVFES